ncbi:hypothetical protein CPC08DRAFT_729808 [Agrocybe pediades]|nr:hypothetical protein CPC08DRAFT_729808 [Agrocybe pediades]
MGGYRIDFRKKLCHRPRRIERFSTVGDVANTNNGNQSTLIGDLLEKMLKAAKSVPQRVKQEVEAYQILFPAVNKADATTDPSRKLAIRHKVTTEMWEAAIPEEKKAVEEYIEKMRKKIKAMKEAGKSETGIDDGGSRSRTPEEYQLSIEQLRPAIALILQEFAEKTGWSFWIAMGGPVPNEGGDLFIENFYVGELNQAGCDYPTAHANFTDGVLVPWTEHLYSCYPADVRASRSAAEPSALSTAVKATQLLQSKTAEGGGEADVQIDQPASSTTKDMDTAVQFEGTNINMHHSPQTEHQPLPTPITQVSSTLHDVTPPMPSEEPGPHSPSDDANELLSPGHEGPPSSLPPSSVPPLSSPMPPSSPPLLPYNYPEQPGGPSEPIEYAFLRMGMHRADNHAGEIIDPPHAEPTAASGMPLDPSLAEPVPQPAPFSEERTIDDMDYTVQLGQATGDNESSNSQPEQGVQIADGEPRTRKKARAKNKPLDAPPVSEARPVRQCARPAFGPVLVTDPSKPPPKHVRAGDRWAIEKTTPKKNQTQRKQRK